MSRYDPRDVGIYNRYDNIGIDASELFHYQYRWWPGTIGQTIFRPVLEPDWHFFCKMSSLIVHCPSSVDVIDMTSTFSIDLAWDGRIWSYSSWSTKSVIAQSLQESTTSFASAFILAGF
jgi:hypothetical protein